MASQALLDLVIRLESDQTNKKLGILSKSVGDIGKVASGLGKTALFSGVDQQVSRLGSSFVSLGKSAVGVGATITKAIGGIALGGAVAGIGAVGAALAGGISDARHAASVMAATENVIESMGRTGEVSAQQISDMAASMSAASGMSLFGDDDIQAGQNMLLTFANITDVLPNATQAMVDMTQFMGGDMVSSATMLGKALDNPTKGLSALSRVGVSFSEQQKEQIKTMQAAGDMAGAQGIILEALGSQFGGAAAAAAAADGGFTQFKDRMGEIAESVGAQVLPALNSFMGWLNSPEVMGAIETFVGVLVGGFTNITTWIGTNVVPVFADVFGKITGIIRGIITPVQEVVTAFDTWKAFGTEWGIVAALEAIGEKFPLVQPLTDWLATEAPALVQGVREKFGLARDAFITFRDALSGEWTPNVEAIHPLHQAVGNFGLLIRETVMPTLGGWFKQMMEGAPGAWATFKESIDEDLMPTLNRVIGWFKQETPTIDYHNGRIQAGSSAWGIYAERVAHNAGEIKKEVDLIIAALKNKSTVEEAETEKQSGFWGNYWRSLNTHLANVQADFDHFTAEVPPFFVRMGINIYNAWQSTNNTLSNAAHDVDRFAANVGTIVGKIPGIIRSIFASAGTLLYQAGIDVIAGFVAGVASKIPSVVTTVASIAGLILKHKGPPEKDAVLLFESGRLIIQGLIDGFGSMEPKLVAQLSSLTDLIGKVFGVVGSGTGALGKLGTFTAPSGSSIDAFVSSVDQVLRQLATVAVRFRAEAITRAGEFADAAGKVFGIIGTGVSALTAIGAYRTTQLFDKALATFADDVFNSIRVLATVASRFRVDAMDRASDFAEHAGKVFGIIGTGVDALVAIGKYRTTQLFDKALASFADDVFAAVYTLGAMAQRFRTEAMDRAADWAESVGKVVGVIGTAVESFAKLNTHNDVATSQMEVLAADMDDAVWLMVQIAKDADTEGVAAAAAFATSVGGVFTLFKTGVESLDALRSYEDVPTARMEAVASDFEAAIVLMTAIASRANLEGVQRAAEYSKASQEVFGYFKAGAQAIDAIRDYESVPADRMTAVLQDFEGAIWLMTQIADRANVDGVAKAQAYAQASSDIFGAFKAGSEAIDSLREYQGLPPGRMDAFSADFLSVLTSMATLVTNGAAALAQAETWKKQMEDLRDAINAGIAAINGIKSIPPIPGPGGDQSTNWLDTHTGNWTQQPDGRTGGTAGNAGGTSGNAGLAGSDTYTPPTFDFTRFANTLADAPRAITQATLTAAADAVRNAEAHVLSIAKTASEEVLSAETKKVNDLRRTYNALAADFNDTVEKGLLGLGSTLSSLGSGFANVLRRSLSTIAPQVAAIDAEIAALQASTLMYAGDLAEGERLLIRRGALLADQERIEGKLATLQGKQQDFAFLQQQMQLVDLLEKYNLNPADILGGMKLGLGASSEDLVDAMTRGMEAIIAQINTRLESITVPPIGTSVGNAGPMGTVGNAGTTSTLGSAGSTGSYNMTVTFEAGSIVQQPGEDSEQFARRVVDIMDRETRARANR